ncbi:MAG: VOC family protein [Gemmatimonadetes bacterium]|nr:VOC family protein [Gemmatimonadota bacterium]
MSDEATAGESPTRAEPQSFRAREMSVSLTVADLDASLAWYRDVVGFHVEERHERDGALRAVTLRAGSVRILLGQDDGARGWDRVKGEGFSFLLRTAQDVDALASGIRARGGTLALEPTDMPWGARIFRLVEPDGFKIAIST